MSDFGTRARWRLKFPASGGCVLRLAVLTAAIVGSDPPTASAQSLDYGSLEALFGEPVTTGATGSPKTASAVPVNMEIVTAEDIRRSGALDIPGVLKHVLGIDVMHWTNNNTDIGVRGYDQAFSPRVLVLIDGRQVYADHYGYTPWAALPVELSAIRQIEVIKGPNAALYGFNAANGVINIITYSPLYDNVNTASISGGTQGTGRASAVKTFKFDGGGVRLSASGRFDNDYSTPIPASTGSLAHIGNDHFAVDLDSVFRVGNNVQIGIEATHSGSASNDMLPDYTISPVNQYTSSLKGVLTADTGLGLLQATVYNNWIAQHVLLDGAPPIAFSGQETVAQFQDLFKLGTNHVFRAALEYRHNTITTSPEAGGDIFYDDYAASGMWDWSILSNLSLTSALRWENLHLGRSGTVPANYPFTNDDWDRVVANFSYSSGLVWKPTLSDTLRLIISKGDQLPSLANFGAILVSSPIANISGTPNINQTVIHNYEIDWDRVWPGIRGQFRAAAFYLQGEGFILPTPAAIIPGSGPPPYAIPANVGNSSAHGIELSLTGKFEENWRWGINYRFESITDRFGPFAGGVNDIDFQDTTPKHVLKANIGWARGRWEIDSYFYYQSPARGLTSQPFHQGSFLTPVPDFLSIDARVAYRLRDWVTLAISAQDFATSPQQQTSGPKVERRVFGTVTVDF